MESRGNCMELTQSVAKSRQRLLKHTQHILTLLPTFDILVTCSIQRVIELLITAISFLQNAVTSNLHLNSRLSKRK